MRCPTDILMRESPIRPFVTSTHYTLADKISSSYYEDKQDDSNDWTDGAGPSIRNTNGGR